MNRVQKPWASLARALLIASLCAAPQLARAQTTGSAQAKRDYQQAVQIGLEEMRLGNYAEAYAAMLRAHRIDPNARTLRAMGIAAFELKRYVTSLDHLRDALDNPRKPLTPEMRQEVQGLIERVETYIEHVDVELDPPEAQLLVDGTSPERDDQGRILLTIGEHELQASADGYEVERRTIRADGSRSRHVTMRLSPVVTENEQTVAAQPAQPRRSESDDGQTQRTWGYIALGASAVFTGGAAVAFGLRESAASTYNSERCAPMPSVRCSDEAARVETMETLSIVGLGAAGAMAVTGIVLLLAVPDDAPPERGARLSCGFGLGALQCAGRF